MIEVLALAGAVTKVASSVSAAVKAGRDIQSLMPQVGKLAKLEADINLAETGKHTNNWKNIPQNAECIVQGHLPHGILSPNKF